MPKIVDKNSKRIEIAKSSRDLVLEKGFSKLTVSEVAKVAGIGKGTIYDYFESKEDIVFEIMRSTQEEYDRDIERKIENAKTPKEKVLHLFDLCISNDKETIERRKIYKEFLIVCLNKKSEDMSCFKIDSKEKYLKTLKKILEDGAKDGELKEIALDFAEGLFIMAEGYLVLSNYENREYEKDILVSHIDSLFKILKEKN